MKADKPTSKSPGVYVELPGLIELRHEARGFSFLPRQPLQSRLAGRHASRLRGRGLNFEEIRRYFPGDDVRQIDWKATMRTRHTQLRIYTEERERSVLLVVDQRRTMFFGSQLNMKSVTAAETAALTAWRVLAQKDRVGAIVFNDAEVREIRPRRSRNNVMQLLGEIVRQNQALSLADNSPANRAMLNTVLHRVEELAKHDFLICLITDGSGHDEETNRILTRISRHNDVLLGFIYDPLEKEIPRGGPVVMTDGTRQLEIDTGDEGFRKDFADTFARNYEQARHFLLHREIPFIPLLTTESVSSQLKHSLGATSS